MNLNNDLILLEEIIDDVTQKLIVRYFKEPYRVICENGSITHIEPQFQTINYVPGTKPGEEVMNGICQLVDAFYSKNFQNDKVGETMELAK